MKGNGPTRSSLHDEPFLDEALANAVAEIALQFHGALRRRASGATRALQLLTEIFQKGTIVRKAEDDGDHLSAASLLLHSEPRNDAGGNRLRIQCLTAF